MFEDCIFVWFIFLFGLVIFVFLFWYGWIVENDIYWVIFMVVIGFFVFGLMGVMVCIKLSIV